MTGRKRVARATRGVVAAATALVLAASAHVSDPAAGPGGAAASVGVDGGAPLFLEPPSGSSPTVPPSGGDRPRGSVADPAPPPAGAGGIPGSVLAAYRGAAARIAAGDPGCALPVALLAAIGRVESHHARGGAVDRDGRARPPVIGLRLDGAGAVARILDTDGGRLDGDPVYDRAVGPMQFIPSTWARWGADGNGDGLRDPQNVHDAALAAGYYLCAGGRQLTRPADLRAAVLSYNRSDRYLRVVLAWMDVYALGARPVDDAGASAGTGIVLAAASTAARGPGAPRAVSTAAPAGPPLAGPRPATATDAAGPAGQPPGRVTAPAQLPPAQPNGRRAPLPSPEPASPGSSEPPSPEPPAPAPSSPEPSSQQPPAPAPSSPAPSSPEPSSRPPAPESSPRPSSPPSPPPSPPGPPPPESCETVRRVIDVTTGLVHTLPAPACLDATDRHRIRVEGGAVADGSVTGLPISNPVLRSVLGM